MREFVPARIVPTSWASASKESVTGYHGEPIAGFSGNDRKVGFSHDEARRLKGMRMHGKISTLRPDDVPKFHTESAFSCL